ncbi:MAG: AraC family transcriptional regulator [Clostridia bacterium]|nr:AraC family transcriptional regulator [Clostridia bacterium]
MNYYERIQKSIDYIESNLENGIEIDRVAQVAYMSSSNYYRMFFALTGYAVKEYIRQRRISNAVRDIKENSSNILDIALKYGFESNEAFTRAFKRIAGFPPSAFKKNNINYSFERVNILEKFIDIQDKELLEKYPDIKVLKELKPMRVAYYCYYGTEPESRAFSVMSDWLKRSGLSFEKDQLRIFGFNNPSPSSPDQKEYGYEVWVTIGEDFEVNDSLVKTKTFEGGLYAVCGVRNAAGGGDGAGIYETWQRFFKWITESKYSAADHQWLEEHLHFNDEFEHTGGIDLYMPIAHKDSTAGLEKEIVFVEPMNTVTISFNGKDAYDEALKYMLEFVRKHGESSRGSRRRVFCYYNHERAGKKDFWCKVHFSAEEDFGVEDERLQFELFQGGQFAFEEVEWINNGKKWHQLIDWVQTSKKYDFDSRPFMEEFMMDASGLSPGTKVRHFMPVRETGE